MLNYIKELLRSLQLFPLHYLLPQATKINVIDLGIRRCSPTPDHKTCYRHSRGGKRVYKKVANIARSIAVNVSTKRKEKRKTTPNYSAVNLDNLHLIPTGTKINDNIPTSRDKNGLHLSLVNTRSLYSKAEGLKYYIVEKDTDVCTVTESWIHKDSTEEALKAIVPEGYGIPSKSHQDGRRVEGIALTYNKRTVTLVDNFSSELTDAKCSLFKINVNQKQLDVCVLY